MIPLFPNYQAPLELNFIWWYYVIKKIHESEILYDLCTSDPLLLIVSVWYILHIFYPPRQDPPRQDPPRQDPPVP